MTFFNNCIINRSPLVPAYSFGEIDVIDQVQNEPSSYMRKCQNYLKKLTGYPLPIFVIGRGFFQYSFGILPHRRRIVQVGMYL